MSRSSRLKQEAARVRGRIDRRACLVRQRFESLMRHVRGLARSPAALPVAFVCGILVERLHMPGMKRVYGLLAGLASPAKALQIASSFIAAPVR